MKKWLLPFALAFAGLGVFPDTGEAGLFRRRCRPAPPCPPVVVCSPAYPRAAYPPAIYPPAPYPVVPPGFPTLEPARSVVIKGKTYQLTDSGEKDEKPDEVEPDVVVGAKNGVAEWDRFKGTSRRVAKTTIFVSKDKDEPEPFADLSALIATLPANDVMRAKNISNASTSNRVAEERRNVAVTAFLYAYKKEPDNDYHVIIGEPPTVPAADRRYLNVEISGIPVGGTNENRARLVEARNAFKEGLGLGRYGPNSYVKPNPPIPVRVTGSLFWDADHENPPYVGPQSHKPKTPWEIHPISKFEYLD